MELKDKLWLWGHDAGSQHTAGGGLFKLPGENKMSPMEGCEYLGIPNMCRVVMGSKPTPPFDDAQEELLGCKRVVWSIIGDCESKRNNNGGDDLDEVIRLSKKYPNVTGGIMDDFMRPERMKVYTPEVLQGFADRLHEAGLTLWTVIYGHEVKESAKPYLEKCDVISYWSWKAEELYSAHESMKRLKAMLPEKSIYAGCYMWDYGNACPMSLEDMSYQLELYKQCLGDGLIDGIIICSNCIADLGLEAVEYTRQWIKDNAEI